MAVKRFNIPDGVQHAGGDALSSGQAEDPDPADPAQSLFWDGGAAPGSVSFHEVVLGHILLSIWLLEDSVSLEGDKRKGKKTMQICNWCHGPVRLEQTLLRSL